MSYGLQVVSVCCRARYVWAQPHGHTHATHPSLFILPSFSSLEGTKHTRARTYRDSDKGLGCIRDEVEQAPNADRGVAFSLDELAYKRKACTCREDEWVERGEVTCGKIVELLVNAPVSIPSQVVDV